MRGVHGPDAQSRNDAAHNEHSETRRQSDRDRIVTTGPAVSSPPIQKCCAEMMSLSVAGSRKIVVGEPWLSRLRETQEELPFSGDQVVCLSHDQTAEADLFTITAVIFLREPSRCSYVAVAPLVSGVTPANSRRVLLALPLRSDAAE